MEYYLLQQHWHSLVRKFKDEERQFGTEPADAEAITNFVIEYIEYGRIRQYSLFTQKRGEEFEKMIIAAGDRGDLLRRFIEDDERWTATLELAAEQ